MQKVTSCYRIRHIHTNEILEYKFRTPIEASEWIRDEYMRTGDAPYSAFGETSEPTHTYVDGEVKVCTKA